MSLVHFKLTGPLAELDPRTVAVQIRDLELDTVAEGVASQALDVEPGSFIAQARLANGRTAAAEVTVESGREAVVVLGTEASPSPPGQRPRSRLGAGAEVLSPRLSHSRLSLSLPMRVGRHGLQAYVRGKGVASYVPSQEIVEPSFDLLADGSVTVRFPPYLEIDLIAVQAPGQPPENIVLPSDPGKQVGSGYATAEDDNGGVELRLSRSRSDSIEATVHLRHGVADAMLAYSGRILFAEAQALVCSQAMSAEALLYEKRANPLAAAAGAYVLLRAGELRRLHNWTANLCKWFPWLADGAAICGEHLAREGKHEEALARLIKLGERGLPTFSDGLGYAVNRLTLYTESGMGGHEAKELLRELSSYALVADFRRTFTTFSGVDPNNPGEGSKYRPSHRSAPEARPDDALDLITEAVVP
jgi:hypothetical protein